MRKFQLTITFCLFVILDCFCQESNSHEMRQTMVSSGIGLGSVIAVVTSWDRNKSVLLAIIHGIFSWLYVIYYVITRK